MAELMTKNVFRRTLASITATILPDTSYTTLLELVKSGVTLFRINLSHFTPDSKDQWKETIRSITKISESVGVILGIMLDTEGPEFRINKLKVHTGVEQIGNKQRPYLDYGKNELQLKLTPDDNPTELCDENTIAVKAPAEAEFLSLGEKLVVFRDGNDRAKILSIGSDGKSMRIQPERKFRIWERVKVNFPGIAINADPISQKELNAIWFFVRDSYVPTEPKPNFMFAQSFVKSSKDVVKFHGLLDGFGLHNPIIIAKIETYESSLYENLAEIVKEASAIMIARGDLANETSRQQVPRLQRRIIKAAKKKGKPVLLATQIYNSMTEPETFHCTRPEAEDVRSALELGVDGFVLTEETTKRPDPETVVKALVSQIADDEKELINGDHYFQLRTPLQQQFQQQMRHSMSKATLSPEKQRWLGTTDFAIAAVFRANTYRAIGIFPLTIGGATVREMSQFYPETEIYALTRSMETAQRLLLYRCAHPILFKIDAEELQGFSVDDLKTLVHNVVDTLDLREKKSHSKYAIGTMAHPPLQPGGTDILLRIRIGFVGE